MLFKIAQARLRSQKSVHLDGAVALEIDAVEPPECRTHLVLRSYRLPNQLLLHMDGVGRQAWRSRI